MLTPGYRTETHREMPYPRSHSKSVRIRTLELLAHSLLCSFIVCAAFCQGILAAFQLVSETKWDFNEIKGDTS